MPILELLSTRTVILQLVALLFVGLTAIGVVLPATFTQAGVVAAAVVLLATITAIARFHTGDDGVKAWHQSKLIWTQIVGSLLAVLALFGRSIGVDPEHVVEGIMAIMAVANIVLRRTSTAAIG